METFPQYRARILGYLGDRDPIRVLKGTPGRLERLVETVPTRLVRRRPGRGSWSILEILMHMADAELAYGWRLRTMLATPGARLAWWDQDIWARRLGYHHRTPAQALRWFRAFRESNLALLLSASRRRLRTAHGVHDVRGRQSAWEFVRQEAGHDLAHLRQIRGTLRTLAGV